MAKKRRSAVDNVFRNRRLEAHARRYDRVTLRNGQLMLREGRRFDNAEHWTSHGYDPAIALKSSRGRVSFSKRPGPLSPSHPDHPNNRRKR